MVGSLDSFSAIVSYIGGRDDLLPSLPFFFRHFVNQCVSRLYGTVIKGLHEYLHLYYSYRLFDSLVRPGTYPLGMCLLDATRTLSTEHL